MPTVTSSGSYLFAYYGHSETHGSDWSSYTWTAIRYGLNDVARIKDFDAAFPKDFRELIARLRKDHPAAMLIPTTTIPWGADLKAAAPQSKRIHDLVRRVGQVSRADHAGEEPSCGSAVSGRSWWAHHPVKRGSSD
jgi:hypothetical protein